MARHKKRRAQPGAPRKDKMNGRKRRALRERRVARATTADSVEAMTDLLVQLGDPIACAPPLDTRGMMTLPELPPAQLALVGPTLLLHQLLAHIVGVCTCVLVERASLRMWAWVVAVDTRYNGEPLVHDLYSTPAVWDVVRAVRASALPGEVAVQRLKRVMKMRRLPAMAPLADLGGLPPDAVPDVHVFNMWERAVVAGDTAAALACARCLYRGDAATRAVMVNRLPLHAMTLVSWQDLGLVLHTFRVQAAPTLQGALEATYAVCTAPRCALWTLDIVTPRDAFRATEFEAALRARDFAAAMSCLLVATAAAEVWGALWRVLPTATAEGLQAWDADTDRQFTVTALAFGAALATCLDIVIAPPRLALLAPVA